MVEKGSSNDQVLRNLQSPRIVRYYIGPRSITYFLLAILVLCLGVIGYVEYNRFVKPYIEVYICCLPAAILAGFLIFFGFASRVTSVKQINIQRPPTADSTRSTQDIQTPEPDITMRSYQPAGVDREELLSKKRNLTQFLKNLDEQRRDGLIMDDVYLHLKKKYQHELLGLNLRLKSDSTKTSKTVKRIKRGNDKVE